jgi:hypothetical protein
VLLLQDTATDLVRRIRSRDTSGSDKVKCYEYKQEGDNDVSSHVVSGCSCSRCTGSLVSSAECRFVGREPCRWRLEALGYPMLIVAVMLEIHDNTTVSIA